MKNVNDFPYTTTFWHRGDPLLAAPLDHDIEVDVAVIGGGFIGLSKRSAGDA